MTGTRAEPSVRCPNYDAALPERDPLVGWWLCDDCAIAVGDDGERIS